MKKASAKQNFSLFLAIIIILSMVVMSPVYANTSTPYTDWKQFDSQWSGIQFGTTTMGTSGCAITAAAILVAHSGLRNESNFDPGVLCNYLKNNGGFSGNSILWSKISGLVPEFKFSQSITISGTQAEKLAKIKGYYDQGYYICVAVKNAGHFVAVRQVTSSNVIMMDPGSSTSTDLFTKYAASGVVGVRLFTAPNPSYWRTPSYSTGYYKPNVTEYLTLRSEANTTSTSLAQIPLGAVLYVSEISGYMGKTTYNGITGWINMKYATSIPAPIITPVPTLTAPTNLKAVSVSSTSTKETWSAVTDATGYAVFRSKTAEGGFVQIATTAAATYTDTALITGTKYYYKIKAYKTVGTSNTYSAATAAVCVIPKPAAPTGLKVTSAGYNSDKISWTAVTGATGYVIYRSNSVGSGFVEIAQTASTTYTNTGLTTGTMYYYKIKAYTTVGTTKYHSLATTAVGAKPIPASPTGISATRISSTSIKVFWSPVAGATGYAVYRSTNAVSGFIRIASSSSYTFINSGLETGTTYYYKIKAYRTVGTINIYSLATKSAGA